MNFLDPSKDTDIKSINKVREIKKEILNFGITQPEILKLIEILCLELEDTNLMKEIIFLIKPNEDTEDNNQNKTNNKIIL